MQLLIQKQSNYIVYNFSGLAISTNYLVLAEIPQDISNIPDRICEPEMSRNIYIDITPSRILTRKMSRNTYVLYSEPYREGIILRRLFLAV